MISFKREGSRVKVSIDHGVCNVASTCYELEIGQGYELQAELLMQQLRKHLDDELSKVKERYYREGWKDAKAKTKKRTEFKYGGWKY
jgi:hypothetical protein